jgi:hypothetical protein
LAAPDSPGKITDLRGWPLVDEWAGTWVMAGGLSN